MLRLFHCKAIRGLPAIHITSDFKVFISVDKDVHGDSLTLEPVELAGFNVGEFKLLPTAAVEGATAMVPFRLKSDVDYVVLCSQDRKDIMPICKTIFCALTENHVPDIGVHLHKLAPCKDSEALLAQRALSS